MICEEKYGEDLKCNAVNCLGNLAACEHVARQALHRMEQEPAILREVPECGLMQSDLDYLEGSHAISCDGDGAGATAM